jgi:hypothetical protein
MNRVKRRIALFLAATAVSSAFLTATPAKAADSCYPYPEVYCNTMDWVIRCVWWRIEYGQSDPSCRT